MEAAIVKAACAIGAGIAMGFGAIGPAVGEGNAVGKALDQELKLAFAEQETYRLVVRTHPLSKVKPDPEFSIHGNYSTYELMQLADAIVTDYSACAFEASLLMKPLYFFVPDYDLYMRDRGLNVDLRQEMPAATFTDADALADSLRAAAYDYDALYAFQSKYVENTKNNNAAILANFVLTLLQKKDSDS